MASSLTITLFLAFMLTFSSATENSLVLNFYKQTCPRAELIVREQVDRLYELHKNTPFSWLRNLFHDCIVESCDASLLLDSTNTTLSEKATNQSFGLRNFRHLEEIKQAVEQECPGIVSCADILVLSARDGIAKIGGPFIAMKTGRRDGRLSRAAMVDHFIPNHNASLSVVLEKFRGAGIDTEGTVALLGSHSVGRTHCVNIVHRLYPRVDSAFPAEQAQYLLQKCPNPTPNPKAVEYARNDRETPMLLDNTYYRNILAGKGLLLVDYHLATDQRTVPYVRRMAADSDYWKREYARAITILSENNPLTGSNGEIRRNCYVAN